MSGITTDLLALLQLSFLLFVVLTLQEKKEYSQFFFVVADKMCAFFQLISANSGCQLRTGCYAKACQKSKKFP